MTSDTRNSVSRRARQRRHNINPRAWATQDHQDQDGQRDGAIQRFACPNTDRMTENHSGQFIVLTK